MPKTLPYANNLRKYFGERHTCFFGECFAKRQLWAIMDRMSTQSEVSGAIPADIFELRLAIARAHAGGISAKEAALRVGVSGQTWRNWENGVHSDAARKPAMLRYIAEQLGVDEHWLRYGGPLTAPDAPSTPASTETTRWYPLAAVA